MTFYRVTGLICYEHCGIGDSYVAGQPRKQLADRQFLLGHAEAFLRVAARQRVGDDLQPRL